MERIVKPKKIFNQDSEEKFDEARIIGGNPTGIINFNKTNHSWATTIYKLMEKRTWFPSQVSITKDIANYLLLTEEEKRTYDLTLAQLISNDSIQTNQLMDRINSYITSPVVNACLSRQACEEANHSFCYSVMAEDICQDTDRIYTLHHHDEELAIKNKAVEDMFEDLNSDLNSITNKDMLIAFAANQILEELIFPGGFVALYSLEEKMKGTSEMIMEIN